MHLQLLTNKNLPSVYIFNVSFRFCIYCIAQNNIFSAIPNHPHIENIENSSVVHGVEDTHINFTCTSTGGYPAPVLSWLQADVGKTISTDRDILQLDDGTFSVKLQLEFIAERDYDWSNFTCQLSHIAFVDPLETFVVLVLSRKFATYSEVQQLPITRIHRRN